MIDDRTAYILGPLLFVLYTAELSQLVAQHRLTLHQYADDCQIYDDMSPSDVLGGVSRFERCLVDVEKWMRASRLRLNASQTNILWLGSCLLYTSDAADE